MTDTLVERLRDEIERHISVEKKIVVGTRKGLERDLAMSRIDALEKLLADFNRITEYRKALEDKTLSNGGL